MDCGQRQASRVMRVCQFFVAAQKIKTVEYINQLETNVVDIISPFSWAELCRCRHQNRETDRSRDRAPKLTQNKLEYQENKKSGPEFKESQTAHGKSKSKITSNKH